MISPSSPAEPPPERHRLVSIRPEAWRDVLSRRNDLAREEIIASWVERGWPLIARRPTAHDGSGLALGLPLPPSHGRRRIAVLVSPDDAIATRPPLALAETLDRAPKHWVFTLNRILAAMRPLGLEPRVFGSLAWQKLTGLDYVTEGSDLDLLLPEPRRGDLDALLENLNAIGEKAPMRIDGEVVRPDGRAANWRELATGFDEILVKGAVSLELMTRSSFVEGLAD